MIHEASWLDMPSFAVMTAGVALKANGHAVTATPEEEGVLRCKHCPTCLSAWYMTIEDVTAAFRDTPALRERCPGEMYRPIPGTPWFEYGPAAAPATEGERHGK